MFGFVEPDHLYDELVKEVERTGTAPTDDPIRHAIGTLLLGEMTAPTEVQYAYSIYLSNYKREVLEAFLITGADAEHINAVLAIPVEVIQVYLAIFFDQAVFRDRLDLETYVQEYPAGHDSGYGRKLKLDALEHGRHWISQKFGRDHYQVPAAAALKETINQAYIFSKVAGSVPIDSVEAREARQWSGTMVNGIRVFPEIADAEAGARDALKFELIMIRHRPGREEISPEDIVTVTEDNE
jgi:hypothetical protein